MGKHKSVRFVSFVGMVLAAVVGGSGACSGGGSGGGGDDDDGGGGVSGQGGSVGYGGSPFNGSAGFPGTGGSGGGVGLGLVVDPPSVKLTAKGEPLTQTFTAKLVDGTPVQGAEWSVDDVALGLVNPGGVFTSKGFSGGVVNVTASFGGRKGTARVEIVVDIAQNPGNVAPEDQGKLQTGGDAKALSFLYPYDYDNAGADVPTVFPRGVGAPLVQLTGSKASAMRLLVETAGYRYEGFFGPAKAASGAELNFNQVPLPDQVWQGLVASAQPGEQIKVTATALIGGNAVGPVVQRWTIAPGSLKGIVYYNTYYSPKAGTGAVMRIKPGGEAEAIEKGCTVCHSVSSQGNRMVASVGWADNDPELLEPGEVPNNPIDSASFELKADGTSSARVQAFDEKAAASYSAAVEDGRVYSFGGLTPDGKWFLSNGVPASDPQIRGLEGSLPSRLVETDTGATVPTPSLQALGVTYAITPAFSHDGSLVAFNRRDVLNGRTLSVMNFEPSAPNVAPVFSNLVDLVTVPGTGAQGIAAWPSFLPDGKAIVYHEGTSYDTYAPGTKGHIRLVEIATKRVVQLNALNGQRPDGSSYLPLGAALEGDLNFEPTVLPVPVGGYYWVFFTSRRAYGNTIAPNGVEPRGGDIYGGQENPSPRKKLWVAAIDLDYAEKLAADPNYDPSHPAFYVTGQEQAAGNMRAFAALEPCRQQGSTCESSTECCDGRSCRQNGVDAGGQPVLQCVDPPPDECAREDESCETAADCCQDPSNSILCINGRCARKPPVIK
ncbi:MAG TPA: hypothetical protein VFS43_25880 [Polyangiaceae bacterium]|nr:hypothetical protein [Polyangiaceae bacterium]